MNILFLISTIMQAADNSVAWVIGASLPATMYLLLKYKNSGKKKGFLTRLLEKRVQKRMLNKKNTGKNKLWIKLLAVALFIGGLALAFTGSGGGTLTISLISIDSLLIILIFH